MTKPRPKPTPSRRLLEIAVAGMIIAVLAAISIPQLFGAREKARTAVVDNVYVALNGEVANELDSVANGLTSSTGERSHWVAPGSAPRLPAAPASLRGPAATDAAPRRLIVYDGRLAVAAARPREALAEAERIALDADGYVESLGATRIVLRVPVARFEEILDRVARLGLVLERSVSAEDVTDRHRALGLRLDTARATRRRLAELLAKAVDEQRLSLLAQIKRLTQTIGELEAEVERLAHAAAFSRIALDVLPREAARRPRPTRELAGFGWIEALDPFESRVADLGAPMALAVPEGMVELPRAEAGAKRSAWTAEAADGSVVRASRFRNEPQGDGTFWSDAIVARIGDDFAAHERSTVGDFEVLRFVGRALPADRYLVAVRGEGPTLELVEIHYPGEAEELRHRDAVGAALRGGPLA